MNSFDIKKEISHIKRPVIILSSKAGLGNYSVGKALQEMMEDGPQLYHYCIEELVCDGLKQSDFLRYRNICENNPWLLYFIYKFPVNYWLKYAREATFKDLDLRLLKKRINDLGAQTVIATNNRAAFWLSALKKRNEVNCGIIAFLTDYSLNPGWKYIFWSYVDKIMGAIEDKNIPERLRGRYTRVEIPVSNKYHGLPAVKTGKNNILITGGGWGLGNIFPLCRSIVKRMPFLNLHIAVGINEKLYKRLTSHFKGYQNIFIYKDLDNLYSLMEICGAVITKPGAVTISEASRSKRKIFLIKGIPGCEYKNMKYALRHLKAEIFSFRAFENWYKDIIIFGDSQIAFWDMDKFQSSLPVNNKGVSGLCSDKALLRFEKDVLKYTPQTAVILIGTNDIARRRKNKDIVSDLSKMVLKSKDAKVNPVLCSVLPVRGVYKFTRPLEDLKGLNILIKNAADYHSVPYIDFWQHMADSNGELRKELTRDGLHPNSKGYEIMTSILLDKLTLR